MDGVSENQILIAAKGLAEIAEEFLNELHRRPTSAELFEILLLALKSIKADRLIDVHPANIIALKPLIQKGIKPHKFLDKGEKDDPQWAVAELNDAAFVAASDFIWDLIEAIRQDTGHNPTLDELGRVLVEGLHRSDDSLLADASPMHIVGIKAEVRKKGKTIPRVGDIVAIPADNGEYFIASVLANNKYGTAYGFFDGVSPLKPVSMKSHPPVMRYPIYSSDDFVATGRWKIIGHDDELRSLFPADPEMYYPKEVIPGAEELGTKIGPYGSGKTATGSMRDLTKEEAEEIGLLDGTYRQIYLPEFLEQYLNRKLRHKESPRDN